MVVIVIAVIVVVVVKAIVKASRHWFQAEQLHAPNGFCKIFRDTLHILL